MSPIQDSDKTATDDAAVFQLEGPAGTVANVTGAIPALTDNGLVSRAIPYEPVTILISAKAIAIGNGKSMLAILNGGGAGVKLKLKSLRVFNTQTSAVTGVVAEFRLSRLTGAGVGGGTTITPVLADTSDSLPSATVMTGATVTGTATEIFRRLWSSDEWGTGTADAETAEHTAQQTALQYQPGRAEKPLTINNGEAFNLSQITNSTAGTFDIEMILTREA